MRRKVVLVGALALALGALGGGIAAASGGSDAGTGTDSDVPITGAELGSATDAALAQTGGGRVTETEVGDEESYYEVEVTLDDGSQVDVQLDRDFGFVSSEADQDGPGDHEGSDDHDGSGHD